MVGYARVDRTLHEVGGCGGLMESAGSNEQDLRASLPLGIGWTSPDIGPEKATSTDMYIYIGRRTISLGLKVTNRQDLLLLDPHLSREADIVVTAGVLGQEAFAQTSACGRIRNHIGFNIRSSSRAFLYA